MGYVLEGRLLGASVRSPRKEDGRPFGVAEVLAADDRGHWVVPVYCDLERVNELTGQTGEDVRLPVRLYVAGGNIRAVLI